MATGLIKHALNIFDGPNVSITDDRKFTNLHGLLDITPVGQTTVELISCSSMNGNGLNTFVFKKLQKIFKVIGVFVTNSNFYSETVFKVISNGGEYFL